MLSKDLRPVGNLLTVEGKHVYDFALYHLASLWPPGYSCEADLLGLEAFDENIKMGTLVCGIVTVECKYML